MRITLRSTSSHPTTLRPRRRSCIRPGSSSPQVIDFIAVDERSVPGAKSTILAEVAAKGGPNQTTNRPNVSDHLPVEGSIEI
ncbi:MAG: hypothetical protein IPF99_26055 [Deltaproteobacteria bacterium]|nr:hypothetical protein [Deltaproteobacteria bacterium]